MARANAACQDKEDAVRSSRRIERAMPVARPKCASRYADLHSVPHQGATDGARAPNIEPQALARDDRQSSASARARARFPAIGTLSRATASASGCCIKPSRKSGWALAAMGIRAAGRDDVATDRGPATDGRLRSPPLEMIQRARWGFMQQPRHNGVGAY